MFIVMIPPNPLGIKCGTTRIVLKTRAIFIEYILILFSNLVHNVLFQMQDGRYTIAGVCLPNPESISSQNELANSTALGHCVHMIQMLSKFLEIPLEYPMEYRGSRSLIFDMVRPANQISSALQKDRS